MVNILEIIKNDREQLCLEDLDYFETELATGGPYSKKEKLKIQNEINKVRSWLISEKNNKNKRQDSTKNKKDKTKKHRVVMDITELTGETDPKTIAESIEKNILKDLELLRNSKQYKSSFKSYIKDYDEVDEKFIEKHFSFFKPWELDAILSVKKMSEEFLNKHFYTLSPDKIARYQQFSESFFMNHVNDLDIETVLNNKLNSWHKKENRSSKLDVFLRLKGVNK